MKKCKHCKQPIRRDFSHVKSDWIHVSGWYQCVMGNVDRVDYAYGVLAEPELSEAIDFFRKGDK